MDKMYNHLATFSKSYLNNFRGLPIIAWQGIILCLIDSLCIGAFYFFTTYFVENLHFSVSAAGTIISFYGLGAIAGGYLGGRLSEKIPPSLIAAACLMLQATGYLALAKISSLHVLRIDAFILGMAAYGFITANYLNLLNSCQNLDQLKVINWLSTVSNLGMGISALLIGFYSAIGLKNIFMIFSGILLLLSGYLLTRHIIFRDDPLIQKKPPTFSCTVVVNNNQPILFNLFMFSTIFSSGIIISQISSTYSLFVQSTFPQLGIKAFSILFSINTLFIILFEVQIGAIFNCYNKILMMGLGSFLLGLGMLMLSFKINFAGAILACIVYSIGEILFFCMAQLLCYQKQQKNNKGRGLGMFRTIYATSRAIGPTLGCYIYYQFSSYSLWYVCAVIGIGCLLGSNYFKQYYISDSI
jgi:predicted MFS family arabinose efflux permease